MPFLRPRRTGPIRRSQFSDPVPALDLREALATKLQAIAQRGAQQDEPVPEAEPPSDVELGGEESASSDDEAEGEESSASSSGASSPASSPVPSPTTAAPTTSALPSTTQQAPTGLSSTLSTGLLAAPDSTLVPTSKEEDASDSDEEDEDPAESVPTEGPSSTSASTTAEAALSSDTAVPSFPASNGPPQQSGDVRFMDGPPPGPPSGISQTTEHVLIAAGSIGATLLLVLIIWGVYTMRKKGLTFRDLVQMSRRNRGRPDRTYDIAKPAVHRMPAYVSDDKERMPLPQPPPQVSLQRFDSFSSGGQRDFLGGSLGLRPSTPTQTSNHRSFLNDSTPPRDLSRAPSNTHSRYSSSPTLLPLQSQSSYDGSPPSLPIQRSGSYKSSQQQSRYSAEHDDIVSPEAPGPTYQNFTTGRRFTTNRNQPNYESHFSWTQSSQAPPTPVEPVTPGTIARSSLAPTERSSVARFRTVDSWVGNQTGRIPSTQMRSQPHMSYRQSTSTNGGLGQVDEGQAGWQPGPAPQSVPEVPTVPSQYQPGGAYHQRQNTAYSDATVFRQHPGEEVKIPRGSLVPSEVLDAHVGRSAL